MSRRTARALPLPRVPQAVWALLGASLIAATLAALPQQVHAQQGASYNTSRAATRGTVVESRQVQVQGGGTTGAVAGAAVGGVLGNQLGRGRGNTLTTVGGAVAGGMAGSHIQRNMNAQTRFDVTVRLDDGTARTITSDAPFAVGARVNVVDGQLRLMN